jgi:FkbM family methyltransferase
LLALSLRGLGVLNWRTPYLSGEDIVSRKIIKSFDRSDMLVLDVGANEGDFTEMLLASSEKLNVRSFEPHPRTYSRLQQRFADRPRVQILNCAVGETTGEVSLFDYDSRDGSEHATVLRDVIEVTHGLKAVEHRVKLIPLDSLDLQGHIGLIKVDVEGFELAVLHGARKLIREKQPNFLIIEFNEMNVRSRTFLMDICNELPGYKVERILPGGKTLELNKPYRAWHHEIFAYQNLLFTRQDQLSNVAP